MRIVRLLLCSGWMCLLLGQAHGFTFLNNDPPIEVVNCNLWFLNQSCAIAVTATPPSGETSCAVKSVDKAILIVTGKRWGVLRWRLVQPDPSIGEFQFLPRVAGYQGGIHINDATSGDFDETKDEGGPINDVVSRFVVNGRSLLFHYNVLVQFRAAGTGTWVECTPLDPVIINRGD